MSARKRTKKTNSSTSTVIVAKDSYPSGPITIPAPPPAMPKLFGIDELRGACSLFSNCNETFNQQFTVEQLMNIYRAYKRSGFDIPPDLWTEQEVIYALAGVGMGAEFDR